MAYGRQDPRVVIDHANVMEKAIEMIKEDDSDTGGRIPKLVPAPE